MLHLRTGTELEGAPGTLPDWSPASDLRVVDPSQASGMAQTQVQVMWQRDDAGAWRIAWVPPIRELTVWFSPAPVLATELFDVLLTIPKGTPEGAEIYVEDSLGNSTTFHPARGTTELVWAGRTVPTAGPVLYTVRCITAGGTTAFTQLQAVRVPGDMKLSASLDPVQMGQAFDVLLEFPGAATAGDIVTITSSVGNTGTFTLVGGELSVTLPGQVINQGGGIAWTAVATRGGIEIADTNMLQQVVPQVTLTVAPDPVEAGRPYTLTVCAVAGVFPTGTTVAVEVEGLAGTTLSATTVPNQACVSFSGLERWHADMIPWRGHATIGDVTTVVELDLGIIDTRAFVNLTGPTHVLSTTSGSNATYQPTPQTIRPAIFSAAISNPEAAANVRLEVLQPGGLVWVTLRNWTRPDRSPLTHAVPVWITGVWHARIAIEHHDAVVTYSNAVAVICTRQAIVVTASDYAPIVTYPTTLTASMNLAPAGFPNTPIGWYYSSGGGPWTPWHTANPYAWASVDTPHRFVWGERFPDGSVIWSNTITVDAKQIVHWHETVPPGGNIQQYLDEASEWHRRFKPLPVNFDIETDHACVLLTPGHTYYINTPLSMRRGVRFIANGATVVAGAGVNNAAIVRVRDNGGGRYNSPDTDWQIIGGDWHCQSGSTISRGFSIVHTKRFRIHGVSLRNVRAGHGYNWIQATGCGGPYQKGVYNVQILACRLFRDTGKPGNASVDDMAIKIESAYSGAAFNCSNDGTVTNNVLVQGNEIFNVTRAVGSTGYSTEGGHWPAGLHSGIRIIGNHFHDIGPDRWGDNSSWNSEGTVRPFNWWDCYIADNTFNHCARGVSMWVGEGARGAPYGNPGMIYVIRNNFHNQRARKTAIFGATHANSGKKWHGVLVEHNQILDNWAASSPGSGAEPDDGYFVGIDDTTGQLPASSHSLVIRYNRFAPVGMSVSNEKAYNKYRGENSSHQVGIYIQHNYVSDGSTDNS